MVTTLLWSSSYIDWPKPTLEKQKYCPRASQLRTTVHIALLAVDSVSGLTYFALPARILQSAQPLRRTLHGL